MSSNTLYISESLVTARTNKVAPLKKLKLELSDTNLLAKLLDLYCILQRYSLGAMSPGHGGFTTSL